MSEAFKKELSHLDSLLFTITLAYFAATASDAAFSRNPQDLTHLCDSYTSTKLGWNQETGLKKLRGKNKQQD